VQSSAPQSRPLELPAANSLARWLTERWRQNEARALVTLLHAWFTDGFATRDPIEAEALLDDLA